jgi:hypothetical protein
MSTTRTPRKPADRKAPAKRTADKPKAYLIEDDVLVWTAKSGAEIRIDLDIPADILAGSLADDPTDDGHPRAHPLHRRVLPRIHAGGGTRTGGIRELLAFRREHRSELRFDFRRFFGISFDTLGVDLPYAEAYDLVEQLLHEPHSHLRMKMRGMTEAVSDADIAQMLLAQRVMNALRGSDEEPIRLPMPFAADAAEQVTPQEYAVAAAHLAANSAFAD